MAEQDEAWTLARWWRRKPLVVGVRLEGIIGSSVGGQLNLMTVQRALGAAFRTRRAAEVALVINSPGGAPVQAARIHDYIRWLAGRHKKRVTAFIEDIAASGGYWLALAADDIVAHPNAIVGSIGVISAGFGFDRALERFGIERRLYATGEHKGMLDPFRPEREGDVAILRELHDDTYQDFVDLVRARRGERLGDDSSLFDGRVFSGRRAERLGLVDAVGDPMAVLRDRHGERLRLKVFTPTRRPWWRRLRSDGSANLLAQVEDRLMWQRYGL